MVKRTVLVLGIFALFMMSTAMTPAQAWFAGAANQGIMGGCGTECPPLYVPAECPEYPASRTVIKTWSCKIEGPCPAPGMPCGPAANCDKGGSLLGNLCLLATAIPTPLDFLFGGCDGVYGCFSGLNGLGGTSGPCGPGYGPVPGAIAGVLSCLSPPSVMFGCYW